jgi:hypothetical protein
MIQPLRRRHRLLIPALFALVLIVSVLAFMHPAPSSRIDALPSSILPNVESPSNQ